MFRLSLPFADAADALADVLTEAWKRVTRARTGFVNAAAISRSRRRGDFGRMFRERCMAVLSQYGSSIVSASLSNLVESFAHCLASARSCHASWTWDSFSLAISA